MHLSWRPNNIPFELVSNGSVATIGAYDGIHLGHQKLLDNMLALAHASGLPSVVMSFEPTPKEYFSSSSPPARLMRFREQVDALTSYGIDLFYCPRFDEKMKNIEVDTFIRQLLIQSLNIRHLVIGDDFRFAKGRQGSIDQLRRAGRALEYEVHQVASVVEGGKRMSSTAIRQALRAGNLDDAARLLGHYYRMSGKVIEGAHLGKELGFPTANVNLGRRKSAVMGIFAVRVSGFGNQSLDAVASVGTRPTFGGTKPILEVHIFDFDEDIYGKYIHVDFVARLRSEQEFDEIRDLVEQMHCDAANAKAILSA
jgi:riboflavin kinase/FMN adenylyltransferase